MLECSHIPALKACLENIRPAFGYSTTNFSKAVDRLAHYLSNPYDFPDRAEECAAYRHKRKGGLQRWIFRFMSVCITFFFC